jgi:hypothetical protein
MHIFKDKEGREWTLDVNVTSIKRVRAALEVNLLDVVDGKLIEELDGNPILLVDVLYVLCKPDAEKRNITDEQFGQAMAGDAIDRATSAFLAELSDFFPNGKRQLLQKAVAKIETLRTMALARATERMDSGELESLMAKLLNGTSTNSPENSASTPDPEPIAS